jgi:hypothetical protein
MNDTELMRLYLLYKAGSVQDGRKNSDLLKIAKATASDLTEEEFIWLNNEIERLRDIQQSQSREKRDTVGIDRVGEKEWSVWQSAKSFAMGSSDYQKRLWELPDLVRSDKPFTPTRLADGNPIDLDPSDPEGSQERLKSQPYSQVKHDPKLRDAWHAAQSGKLADMLRGGDVWQAYTDPSLFQEGLEAAKPVRSGLSAPLRSLLSSMDRGELDSRMQSAMNGVGRDQKSYEVYKDEPSKWISRLTGDDRSYHAEHLFRNAVDEVPTSVRLQDVVKSGNEEDARKWVHEVREYHEKKVRQNVVDYQIKGYRPSIASQADTIQPSANDSSFVSAPPIVGAPNLVSGNVVAPPIDLGEVARKNAANGALGMIEDPSVSGSIKSGFFGKGIDSIQSALDVAGVADPTPIVDGVNAGISVVRALTDPQNAGTHLVNAGVSAASMVPFVGDLAKLFKYGGKGAKTAEAATSAGAHGGGGGGIGGTIGGIVGGLGGSGGNSGGDGSGGGFNLGGFASLSFVATGLVNSFVSLKTWIDKSVQRGHELIESQRDLAKYSGELSNAFAKYDTAKVFRDVREAEYLGTSTAKMARAQADLEDAEAFRANPMKRLKTDFETLQAQASTYLSYAPNLLNSLSYITRGIYMIADGVTKSNATDPRNVVEAFAMQLEAERKAEEAKKNPPKEDPLRFPADAMPMGLQERINRLKVR